MGQKRVRKWWLDWGHTFDGLWLPEVLRHNFHARRGLHVLQCLRNVLQDHTAGKFWVFGTQPDALVAEPAANVDEEHFFRARVRPRADLLLHWKAGKPVRLSLARDHQVLLEVLERLLLLVPGECWKIGLVHLLQHGLCVVGDVLVFVLGQEGWNLLEDRAQDIKAMCR